MALIYLDTSHLSLLARTRSKEPERFDDFVNAWRSQGHVLTLSLFHLIELRQHSDKQVRADRYAMLEDLLPLRFTLQPRVPSARKDAEDREIFRALLMKRVIGLRGGNPEEWIRSNVEMFPHTIGSREELAQLRAFIETPLTGFFVRLMRAAIALATKAQHRREDQKYESPKPKELPTSGKLGLGWRIIFKVLTWFINAVGSTLGKDERASMEQFGKFIERCQTIGAQAAYAEYAGLTTVERERRRLDRISADKLLKDRVHRLAHEVLGATDTEAVRTVVSAIRLNDCPGTWLKHAIDLEVRKAEHAPDASNTYDLEHIRYLPYVDLLTTDTRIAHYTRQVFRRGNLPDGLNPNSPPAAIPESIDALEELICRDFSQPATPPAPAGGRGSGG